MSPELTTNQRLVVAVLRLIVYGELPHHDDVTALARVPNPNRARALADQFLNLAELRCTQRHNESGGPMHTLPERLARSVIVAADLAYDVRAVAQGQRGSAPGSHVWALLIAVLACLVVDAHNGGGTAREELRRQVATVVVTLADQ